jgi:hypothetical protein
MNKEAVPPLFSLAYTSARPGMIKGIVDHWNKLSALRNHEWVMSVDEGDEASLRAARQAELGATASQPPVCSSFKVVVNRGARTCVAGWNTAAAATAGKIIIAVADDFSPPKSWDTLLLGAGPKGWEDGEHVVHINDGYVQSLCTLAILTRKRYDKLGYLFYPKYLSLFCDTEFGEVAVRDGVVIEAMHLLFEHMHPDCKKRPRDNVDLKHASRERWEQGETLFQYRQRQGFPIDDGPKAVKAPAIAPKADKRRNFAAYMQVTGDDFCLLEVCRRMQEEGVKDIFWAEPDQYWSGEALEPGRKAELDAVAVQAREAGLNLRRRAFSVQGNRMPGDSRITVETHVRNESLDWVRKEGFKDILIVDGDELWKPGTLSTILPYIEQGHSSVMTYMVPVIGLPGWPVGEAVDTAVVYIGGTSRFKICRSPLGRFIILPSPLVIHFTGTRRTMDETIAKHKRSGHYDDPDYLFDLWIKEVLPRIRPGFTYRWPNGIEGLHFYVKKQIWPRVREWLPDEVSAIPKSLHHYLGGFAANQRLHECTQSRQAGC